MINTDQHISIVGITGSGKTYFSRWMYRNMNGFCVYYNTQLSVGIERDSDAICYDIGGFKKAFNAEENFKRKFKKICYNPDEDEEKARIELHELIRVLFRLGYQINKSTDEPTIWCHIFIDETHEYSSQLQKDPIVDRLWKRGRRYGIVAISISQRPAEVSHTILANCPTHVIFKTGQYELPYYQRYHIPIFTDKDAQEWITRKYHFIVFYDGEIEKYPPVK